jgi:hypothetical protein
MKIGALPSGSMMTTSVMNASANARQFMPSVSPEASSSVARRHFSNEGGGHLE